MATIIGTVGVFGLAADQQGIILESQDMSYKPDNKIQRDYRGKKVGIIMYDDQTDISLTGYIPRTDAASITAAPCPRPRTRADCRVPSTCPAPQSSLALQAPHHQSQQLPKLKPSNCTIPSISTRQSHHKSTPTAT